MTDGAKILVVEDSERDAELLLHELARGGLSSLRHLRVQTESAMRAALQDFRPDIVLCDFAMPSFSGMDALELRRELAPDTPFIFVSGNIGEEIAVAAMRAGASDYVMKHQLPKVAPAVRRELEEAASRRSRRRAEAGLRRAQAMAELAHVVTGADGQFLDWSETLPVLLGCPPAAVPTSTRAWLERIHDEDRGAFRDASIRAGRTGQREYVEYRLRRESGEWIHVRQAIEPDPSAGAQWFSTIQNVTAQKLAEQKIGRLTRVYAVLSGINALIVRVRERGELFSEACRIAVEDGKFPAAWIGMVDRARNAIEVVASRGASSASRSRADAASEMAQAARAVEGQRPLVASELAPNGDSRRTGGALEQGVRSAAFIPLVVAGGAVGVLALHAGEADFFDDAEMRLLSELAGDIAFALEHIDKTEKLDYLAYYDELTGFANRRLFHDRLTLAIAAAARDGRKLALVLHDIERFKTINDTFGRQAGDALLRAVADRLSAVASDPAWLGRLAADQFAVWVPDAASEEEVVRRTRQRQQAVFGPPFDVNGTELRLSARIGIAMYPSDGTDAESLLHNAEAALKKAKAAAEPFVFYAQQMTERVAEKLALETRLRAALEKQEFILHYQPKIEVETRRIVGAEALLRWQSPELGLVAPARFIPLLEETGLIREAGAWALKRAAADHRSWIGQGLMAPRVAVNVSVIQFRQRDFVQVVRDALLDGANPSAIDLEITESLIMENIEAALEKLAALRALGVGLGIDDFGTGYSSLSYLARLPVETLKIDRSFIAGMLANSNTTTLVHTVISLAHSLRLKVVAEGVETEEQAKMLRLLRCDQMQGFLFSKPVPAAALAALLRGAPPPAP